MALTTLSVVISFSVRLIKRAHRSLLLVSVTKSILRTILMSKKTKLLFMSSSVTACRVYVTSLESFINEVSVGKVSLVVQVSYLLQY